MNGMIKKYLPFALIIFGVYLLVPLIFLIPGLNNFSAVAYYFIFLVTQVACSAFYCSKHGLDHSAGRLPDRGHFRTVSRRPRLR